MHQSLIQLPFPFDSWKTTVLRYQTMHTLLSESRGAVYAGRIPAASVGWSCFRFQKMSTL
jgi:hypothetical protein